MVYSIVYLGNGSSGMVHLCLSMLDNKKYAVKIGTPRHGEYKEPRFEYNSQPLFHYLRATYTIVVR
jgi:hypothetical protein